MMVMTMGLNGCNGNGGDIGVGDGCYGDGGVEDGCGGIDEVLTLSTAASAE